MYLPSTFCTGRSAFDIGFNSVFRLPAAGRYLVLSIPSLYFVLGTLYLTSTVLNLLSSVDSGPLA